MEQRRTRRFQLALPLAITRTGADRVALAGLTKNISSSGGCFTAGAEPDLCGRMEYIITLNHEGPQAVNLRGIGKVHRGESSIEGNCAYQIAATLEPYQFVRDR